MPSAWGGGGLKDPLSCAVSVVRTCSLADPELFVIVKRLVRLEPSPTRDMLLLIKDPMSLNIQVPIQAENVVKRRLERAIPLIIRNKTILNLFSVDTQAEEKRLVHDLATLDPCNPRLMNKIYTLSNVSIREVTVSQFTNSGTIRAILRDTGEDELETEFREEVKRRDKRATEYVTRMRMRDDVRTEDDMWLHPETRCSTEISQHLRCKTWGMKIAGVTMPPPQEQVSLVRWSCVENAPSRAITLFVDDAIDKYQTRGRHAAYLGSRTVLRTRRAQNQIIDVDNTVKTLETLTELLPWVTADEEVELGSLLRLLISEKTTVKQTTNLI